MLVWYGMIKKRIILIVLRRAWNQMSAFVGCPSRVQAVQRRPTNQWPGWTLWKDGNRHPPPTERRHDASGRRKVTSCVHESGLAGAAQQLRYIQMPLRRRRSESISGPALESRARGIHCVSKQNPIKLMTSLSKWIAVHVLINPVTGVLDKLSSLQKWCLWPCFSVDGAARLTSL